MLKDDNAFLLLLSQVQEMAKAETLLTETFSNDEVKLLRVQDEEPWDYVGPTKGIILYLHDDCDPVRLEFDRDLYIQEFVKTQFAGLQIHQKLIPLLRDIKKFFRTLNIEDEGEYWETGDAVKLAEHLKACNEAIEAEAKKNPSWQTKVRTPDGRIMDMMT